MSAPRIESKIAVDGDEFRARAEHNRALVGKLRADVAEAANGGNEKSRERHVSRGKLLPRNRVERLLDPGSPFLELSPLAALDMYDNEAPGSGVITGVGRVSGVECVVVRCDRRGRTAGRRDRFDRLQSVAGEVADHDIIRTN